MPYYFFKVIHQISRSHRTKNRLFLPELSISGLWLQFEFTNGFEMTHKVWCRMEEVPYCFSRSFIKFQGHTCWLIDDFNPIWVRLLGQSHSNLPCDGIAWKKWQIAIKCDGKSMMTDNYLNMKEILKLLNFNYIISDYLWSYGDYSISPFIYLFIYLSIYLFIHLFIYSSIYLFINLFIWYT